MNKKLVLKSCLLSAFLFASNVFAMQDAQDQKKKKELTPKQKALSYLVSLGLNAMRMQKYSGTSSVLPFVVDKLATDGAVYGLTQAFELKSDYSKEYLEWMIKQVRTGVHMYPRLKQQAAQSGKHLTRGLFTRLFFSKEIIPSLIKKVVVDGANYIISQGSNLLLNAFDISLDSFKEENPWVYQVFSQNMNQLKTEVLQDLFDSMFNRKQTPQQKRPHYTFPQYQNKPGFKHAFTK